MNIRSLFDGKKKKNLDDTTNSFVGGEKSALSIQNAPCVISESPVDPTSKSASKTARKISLYSNGFIIDGGDFRSFSDPENEEFISKIKAGYAPKELHNSDMGPVSLVLEDLRSTTYTPPSPPKHLLFSGEGRSTGTGQPINPETPVMPQRSRVQVDPNLPTTVIQFRFYDGTTIRQTFNQTQTVGDLYNYVFETAPLNCDYQLLSGFPPSPITHDLSLTLKETGALVYKGGEVLFLTSGLLSETIIQRCCP